MIWIAIGLILIGGLLLRLYPAGVKSGSIFMAAGLTFLLMWMAGAVAADLPVPPKGVSIHQMRAAIANHDRHKRMTRRQFRNMLLSPIGRGRME